MTIINIVLAIILLYSLSKWFWWFHISRALIFTIEKGVKAEKRPTPEEITKLAMESIKRTFH